jgi:FixJ family two-component response regulator
MPTSKPIVYVVDDDPAMREALGSLIETVSLEVDSFASANAFLEQYSPGRPSCLVLDVRLPGLGGLDLQEMLAARNDPMPVLLITGHGDVAMAVRAIKMGAVDFIQKPFNDQVLLDKIQKSVDLHRRRMERHAISADIDERIKRLSAREADVMERVVVGKSNRTIAAELGLSPKTIEVHRAHVMEKMKATSLAELVRLHIATAARPEKRPESPAKTPAKSRERELVG